ARANAETGQFDNARRCISEATAAVETAKERWCEAEVNRIGGEIALLSPEPDLAKAKAYFAHALAVARQRHTRSQGGQRFAGRTELIPTLISTSAARCLWRSRPKANTASRSSEARSRMFRFR